MKKLNDHLATLLGAATSICTAFAVIDIYTIDIKKDWFKLIVIGVPALGGYVSTIKPMKKRETIETDPNEKA